MSDRAALERHGYDADATPIDTLMSAPVQMHLDVAEAMENHDDDDCD